VTDLLAHLNPQQRQAVVAPLGPLLVLAGPGSGKTRVLTHRLAFLVSQLGVEPGEIMAVTFTNKAAREMSSRLETLLPGSAAGRPGPGGLSLGTFHALAGRMLRHHAERLPVTRDFVIFDDSDQQALMRQVLKNINVDSKQMPPGRLLAAISSAKNELIPPDAYPRNTYLDEVVQRAYLEYQQRLLANNALDFDDLLMMTVELLRQHEDLHRRYQDRYRHILVDEFQDTNTAQYVLLRLLAGDAPDLFVVGDADQSIYRWRGADYRNVQRFEQEYPNAQVILLEQNYRSTQNILDAAMGVIDRLPARRRKRLFTERGRGNPIVLYEAYDEADEAQYVVDTIASLTLQGEAEPGDCAVMYRTNAQSRALEDAFLKAGLPYRLVGAQRFYGRREVKDLIAYLRLIENPSDQISLLRVLNTPPRGLGAKTVASLLEAAARRNQAPSTVLLELAGKPHTDLADAFTGRAAAGLTDFGHMLAEWIALRPQASLLELIDRVLADTGYRAYLDDGSEEGAEHWENVLELRGVADELRDVELASFLDHVALVSDQDTMSDSPNAPTLLTLHTAKGLEFPVVLIIGLDEGLVPHQRSMDDAEEMAEERRLFYVGITRAMNRVYLVRAFRRRMFGVSAVTDPSRFLDDLPADVIEGGAAGRLTADQSSYQRQTRWESFGPGEAEARYHVGMHLRHPTFGEGIVMASFVDHGEEEVTIAFEAVGVKRLAASLAQLEILDADESDS
jgi:DNA helicase-2/ATP-dependent DNA helicase PcrA